MPTINFASSLMLEAIEECRRGMEEMLVPSHLEDTARYILNGEVKVVDPLPDENTVFSSGEE